MKFSKVGLGGSCHWCTEAIFQSLIGVTKVEQGWISSKEFPIYSEAVIVHFDPLLISLSILIEVHLHTHSCTSTHSMRDKYRSAIYVYNQEQIEVSQQVIAELQNNFEETIITRVLTFEAFKLNSEKYLDYYYNNPEKAFCENIIDPKLKKLVALFAKRVDEEKLQLK